MYDNELPLSGLTIINYPSTVKIQVEKRRVKFDNNIVPSAPNAWIYRNVFFPLPPGHGVRDNYLGPVINVEKGSPCHMHWFNTLSAMPGMPNMQEDPPINPKPMDSSMNRSVGIVAHLHGGKVPHDSDGWPLDPVTYQGSPYPQFKHHRIYHYPNDQRAAMLWFHDHAMDNTAPQVFAGLAGLYFIRDSSDNDIFGLIGGAANEIPLVIQDRNLTCGYEQMDYWGGIPTQDPQNPTTENPKFARPEFLGETIFVNGRATPFTNVQRKVYRLRILNGSNARTYALALTDPFWWNRNVTGPRVWYSDCLRAIGNDGGLFARSVPLGNTDYLLISPGERLDVLLDLTAVPNVDCLRLVNLAVASAIASAIDPNSDGLEGIFQTDKGYIVPASNQPALNSVRQPKHDSDTSLFSALKLGQANIMQFCIGSQPASVSVSDSTINPILEKHADDEGFVFKSSKLEANPANALGIAPARNRLVLLMNNTQYDVGSSTNHPLAGLGFTWNDTQTWELGSANGAPGTWDLPFSIDTDSQNPSQIDTTLGKTYGVYRTSFFKNSNPSPVNPASGYPTIHAPTFLPRAGTYERWYVINIGNAQPVANETMDLHPFHMHLVNFIVQNRWAIDGSGQLQPNPSPRLSDFDGIARHDTVRVQANELLELLVYFPPGYTGDYVYHCHLVEHEDMGMMQHFKVQP